ncbi:MAG: GTP 3',8-cyclase MoaA [Eubacteriales bacterium]|nr:GTP 3',8-cyclase MoaA [Eubacteriales bacterium]
MIDRCGRNIDYLRVSVTDRCNLRCIYCMPEDGVELVDRSFILQEPEIVRICRVMAELGIRKIKLTGGEPLVRAGIPSMVEKLKSLPGIETVTLTTNGILLKEQMAALAGAGLDGLNISLDTVNPQCYEKIARRNQLKNTLEAIEEALKYPQVSLKINCVPLGIEEQDLCGVAQLAEKHPIHVRFIEMMPIGYGREFTGMPEEEVVRVLEQRFPPLIPYQGERLGNGPCHYYTVEGFQGKIGFISAVSHKFCGDCNRIRLTSQGFLKTCLQYTAGRDLRAIIRDGKTDEYLKEAILEALSEKPEGHAFLEKARVDKTEKLCMSQIGG